VSLFAADGLDADALIPLSPAVPDASMIGDVPNIPILIAVAEGDEPFATEARELGDVLGVRPLVLSGSAHGARMLTDHPDLAEQVAAFASE